MNGLPPRGQHSRTIGWATLKKATLFASRMRLAQLERDNDHPHHFCANDEKQGILSL